MGHSTTTRAITSATRRRATVAAILVTSPRIGADTTACTARAAVVGNDGVVLPFRLTEAIMETVEPDPVLIGSIEALLAQAKAGEIIATPNLKLLLAELNLEAHRLAMHIATITAVDGEA